MFKSGDKVVCINNVSTYGNTTEPLDMYHTYIVEKVIPIRNHMGKFISIVPKGYLGMGFNEKRFVHLTDFRKMKIDKIKKRLK